MSPSSAIYAGASERRCGSQVMRCWFQESRGFEIASVGRPRMDVSIDTRSLRDCLHTRRRRRRLYRAAETWETAALDVRFEFQENSFCDATGFALANTGGWVPNG